MSGCKVNRAWSTGSGRMQQRPLSPARSRLPGCASCLPRHWASLIRTVRRRLQVLARHRLARTLAGLLMPVAYPLADAIDALAAHNASAVAPPAKVHRHVLGHWVVRWSGERPAID